MIYYIEMHDNRTINDHNIPPQHHYGANNDRTPYGTTTQNPL